MSHEHPDQLPIGRLACSVTSQGDSELRWEWDDLGVFGEVYLRGGGAQGLSDLRSWWASAANRGF